MGRVQEPRTFPASPLPDGVTGDNSETLGLELREIGVTDPELRRTRVTGCPACRRASMNGVNASHPSPLPECVSSCSSGNNSRGSSPSSSGRQRESSLTSPSSTRSVFTLLNDLRRLRHSAWLTSLCSSNGRLFTVWSRVRCSTVEDI